MYRKRRKWSTRGRAALLAIAATGLIFGAAGCGGTEGNGDGGDSDEPIVIGAAVGETGVMSTFDGPVLQAAKMAVEDINAEGGVLGRQLELVVEDTKSDIAASAGAGVRAMDQGATFLMTSCDFDFASGAAFAAQDAGVINMSCAGSPQYGAQGIGDTAFSMNVGSAAQGYIMAELAYEQGHRTAYILEDTWIEFNKSLCASFTERWTELAGEEGIVGRDTFLNDDSSIASQVTRLEKAQDKADFLAICSQPPGGASAVRQIRGAGIDIPIIASDGFDGSAWLTAVPKLSDFYITALASIYGDDPKPAVQQLVKDYIEETGEEPPNSFLVMGYSMVEAYAKAVEKAGTTDGPEVIKALESFDGEELMVGPTSYSPEVHIDANRPVAIIEIKNGKPALLEYRGAEGDPPLPAEETGKDSSEG